MGKIERLEEAVYDRATTVCMRYQYSSSVATLLWYSTCRITRRHGSTADWQVGFQIESRWCFCGNDHFSLQMRVFFFSVPL